MGQSGVVFVGGGRATATLIDLFRADRTLTVVGVVDPNPQAIGMLKAREYGFPTGSDLPYMVGQSAANLVVEVTGNEKVRQNVIQAMRPDQEIMSARAARIMVDMVLRQNEAREQLEELTSSLANAVGQIDDTSNGIQAVLREIRIVTVNAAIEATRLGSNGAAFGVVSERMRELAQDIGKAVTNIGGISHHSRDLLGKAQETEKRLRVGAA